MTDHQPTMDDALVLLQKHWGFDTLRKAQEESLEAIIAGLDLLAILPTANGKSAIFQIAALLYPGTAIVVSPLIALMKDQVEDCHKRKIPASFINSSLDESEIEDRLNNFRYGEYKVFYVSPERLDSHRFRDAVDVTPINFLVVDEVHCISRNGHDFRPAYMRIGQIKASIQGGARIIAVTATATKEIEGDIVKSLGMGDYRRVVGDPVRPNLDYVVWNGNPNHNFSRYAKSYITGEGRHIIYGGTRKKCENLAEDIVRQNPTMRHKVGVYHAGMNKLEREETQDKFKRGLFTTVVATNAFGMGIDIPDIRTVCHFGIPGCLEDYCQEAGRAGRDGKPSTVILIHDEYAVDMRQKFIDNGNPPYTAFQVVWKWLTTVHEFGETISLTGETISIEIARTMNLTLPPEQVLGALHTMDSYQIIERRACDAGLTVSFVGDKGKLALAQAELSESKMAVLTNLCARYDAEAVAPVVIGAEGVQAGERPRIVDFLVDRDALGLACSLSQTAVSSALKTLRDAGILELGAVFRGKTTKVKPEFFAGAITEMIPVENIEARRRREKMRLQIMCGYISAIDKRGYIRRYFES